MIKQDFCFARRGKHLLDLKNKDLELVKPIDRRGKGKEKALLILHGFSSTPAAFRFLIPQLSEYDAVVCPLLPGHGESIEAFSQAKASQWQNKTAELCGNLMAEYKKVDVLGLSLGGLLATHLSQSFALNHLFLLAPALKLRQNTVLLLGLAKFLKVLGFKQIRNAAGNLFTEQHAELAYRRVPVATVIEILQLIHHYQWAPPTCPVDLFLGQQDEVVDSEQVAELFAPLPNVTMHWLVNSAHVLPLDNDVEQVIQTIHSINKTSHSVTGR